MQIMLLQTLLFGRHVGKGSSQMYRILKFVVKFFRTGFCYFDRILVMRPWNNFTSKCGASPSLLAIESWDPQLSSHWW